jgi:hypothetical protein
MTMTLSFGDDAIKAVKRAQVANKLIRVVA